MERSDRGRAGIAEPEAEVHDLGIVGAGPVGLYGAYYAGFRGLGTVVLDSLSEVGGQITAFYADAAIHDVPGFPAVTGRELVDRLSEQASAFPHGRRLGETVLRVERRADRLLLTTDHATRPACAVRALLLTTGIGRFVPQKLADPSFARFEGRGLSYERPDAAAARGRRVVVLGGTPRAVALALDLEPVAASVHLVHRRERLPIGDDLAARWRSSGVRFLPFRELAALEGAGGIERAHLRRTRRDDEPPDPVESAPETLEVDLVLACLGFAAAPATPADLGLTIVEDGRVAVDSRMETGVAGVWAAGDLVHYPGKVRVLAADFGEVCTAVNNIAAALLPGAPVFPGYSSHRAGGGRPRRARGRDAG